ncbi:MAG: hypothetical protein ACOCUI_01235 [bacterium]
MQTKNKMYRTLLKVDVAHKKGVVFIIPSWTYNCPVYVEKERIPKDIYNYIINNLYKDHDIQIYAKCNIKENAAQKLKFEDWER